MPNEFIKRIEQILSKIFRSSEYGLYGLII